MKYRIPLRGDDTILPMGEACGCKAGKPEGWKATRYPTCNRPRGHQLPHREYDKVATVLYEWYEPLNLDDTDVRRELRAMADAERRRMYGQSGR